MNLLDSVSHVVKCPALLFDDGPLFCDHSGVFPDIHRMRYTAVI
jgi:hypothetical protein